MCSKHTTAHFADVISHKTSRDKNKKQTDYTKTTASFSSQQKHNLETQYLKKKT